tara:strand:- start:34 stop:936 length:903 start_codon:yes stop_codon:yes gene_type:complete
MELLNQILLNNNFKLLLLSVVIITIVTMNPPINSLLYNFYNNIIGKIVMLCLIIYYSSINDDISYKLSLFLTMLYVLLLINVNTQNNISNYGKDLHNSLYGGDMHESHDSINKLINATKDNPDDVDINEFIGGEMNDELESTEEENMNIDSKIENIIQEEIVLNKKTYKDNLKKHRKLGVKQYKLDQKRKNIKDSLDRQSKKYKHVEDEYNKIMEQVEKYDTNNDGAINYNDISPEDVTPEMENIEEEMQELEKKFNTTLQKMKPAQDNLDSIVSSEKAKTTGGSMEIEGFSDNMYSVPY